MSGPRASLSGADGGIEGDRPGDPCVLVIFGATGDLTRRELLPSLYELAAQDLLPEPFAVVGFARREWDDETFRREMEAAVREDCTFREETWEPLARRLHFVCGDFGAPPEGAWSLLAQRIEEVREEHGIPDNLLFHLATPPSFFTTVTQRLDASGLARSDEGYRRLIVEKPFGRDRASARELDEALARVFDEDQTYRIDHYLGKETVQNMLVFRFANPGFEPIWNRDHVDHIQITAAESIGIGSRAGFYEETGVVRDMVQNHLLQLLCMATMDPPVRFDGTGVRNETAKILRAIEAPDPEKDAVRAQYAPGCVDGDDVPGYRDEEGVADDSVTPTFAALRLTIDTWRWADVPIYLRTGKRLARKSTEVSIHFKPTPRAMFPGRPPGARHVLTFRLAPDEGIHRTFTAKRPGPAFSLQDVSLDFCYADAFEIDEPPRAYAWLLMDAMQGDATLFARRDWIDRAWEIVDPVVEAWEDASHVPTYEAGSQGPAEARKLLSREGRAWMQI
jgi:glucose-6-phosphate 1-dehydrogenase